MSGIKQFDRDDVLDRAAEQFWRAGYDATSIQDLEMATGLGRGSLYNAFGDKQAIFLAALERYGVTHGSEPLKHLAESDVRPGIEMMLRSMVKRMADPDNPRGCLVTNTCGNKATDVISATIAAARASMEQAIEVAIRRAAQRGELAASADPKALARFYTAVAQSLGLMNKAGADADVLEDVIAVALSAWPGN